MKNQLIDESRAINRLLHFLSVEGVTGLEAAIGKEVVRTLVENGVPRKSIRFDDANEHIPLPTQTGNLIVTLPGTLAGPRLLFSTHLDTVPLCAGARPMRRGDRIVPAGPTALGGDNRTGVACLVTLIATLLKKGLPHPPLTFLFTVREESGLWGARFVERKGLLDPVMGFNVDGGSPRQVTVGAVGAERWQVEIYGRASHAGVHPEQGISATAVASLALAGIVQAGWFGKVVKNGQEGTSNVGRFGGKEGRCAGEATNVVTDYVLIHGEARSHDAKFVRQITHAYRAAFHSAADEMRNDQGKQARVRFATRLDYKPFHLKENSPVVRHALAAAEALGIPATLRVTNGGLDANWLVRRKIPTVTIGAGQHNPHTLDEYADLGEFLEGCRMVVALATQEAV
jgi:tripeptide aminopeptidase